MFHQMFHQNMYPITFAIELDPKKNKNGLHQIRIRLTQNRKHKRFNVGYAIEEKYWNKKKGEVRSTHPLSTIINAAIHTKKIESETLYLNAMQSKTSLTINQVRGEVSHNHKDNSQSGFCAFYLEVINKIKNAGTRAVQMNMRHKILDFLGGREMDIRFEDIDTTFLENYAKYLKEVRKNSDSTIYATISNFKQVWKKAAVAKKFKANYDTFWGLKIKRGKSSRVKLTIEQITTIENLEITEGTNKYYSRDIFLLCYYLLGVRISSMIKMKWSNIEGNRCRYNAAKGEKSIDAIIIPKAQKILDYYKARNVEQSEYIFPFLKKGEIINLEDDASLRAIERSSLTINKYLKQISKELGIENEFTSHTARHSFAYNARKNSNNDIYAVQKALAHSSITTTENYFGSEEVIEADELSRKLFGE